MRLALRNMRITSKYRVLSKTTAEELEALVNDYIKCGDWQPLGGICIYAENTRENQNRLFYQAMVHDCGIK
jgi:hypothetical protein